MDRFTILVFLCFLPCIAAMCLSTLLAYNGHHYWAAFWALFALIFSHSIEITRE